MIWLSALIALGIYAPLLEYVVHRWTMHYPGLGKGGLWRGHAVEHHGRGRNDLNIYMGAQSVVIAASPLFLFSFWLGWPWVTTLLAVCIAYAWVWSTLHAYHHDIEEGWLKNTRIYAIWRGHHLLHHEDPNTNFGTVFIFMDRLFSSQKS